MPDNVRNVIIELIVAIMKTELTQAEKSCLIKRARAVMNE